jgi:uncharacterized protein YndB with AHSA1/START domain
VIVTLSPVVVESYFEFSPAILWDALTDPDLVSGWLAPATIDPQLGGEFTLEWAYPTGVRVLTGQLSIFEPYRRIEFADPIGIVITVELTELAAGLRGTSTHVRVAAVTADAASVTAGARADWLTALDQLDELLRGHPVDWSSWSADHLESWTRHLREVENTIA